MLATRSSPKTCKLAMAGVERGVLTDRPHVLSIIDVVLDRMLAECEIKDTTLFHYYAELVANALILIALAQAITSSLQ